MKITQISHSGFKIADTGQCGTKSHCIQDKDVVYFELDETEQKTWSKLENDCMRLTQPSLLKIQFPNCQNPNLA